MVKQVPPILIVAAFLVPAVSSCDKAGSTDPLPRGPESNFLPTLQEVELDIPVSELPVNTFTTFALTSSGTISYMPDRQREPLITSIDSSGRVIARWGRRGEGPGELLGDEELLSADSFVVAVGGSGERVRVYDVRGSLLAERSDVPQGFAADVSSDRIAWWQSFKVGRGPRPSVSPGRVRPLVSWCIWDRCLTELLSTSDTLLRQVHESATPILHGAWPAFGIDGERLVLGDGYNYTLWVFPKPGAAPVRFGRALPPRMASLPEIARAESSWARLERTGYPGPRGQRVAPKYDEEREFIRTVPMPHFQLGGIKFDGLHRLWVIGRAGDSTFFDVFADTTFLGRFTVACRRFGRAATVRGRWMAIGCETDDDLKPYVIRLFRIVDPPAGE